MWGKPKPDMVLSGFHMVFYPRHRGEVDSNWWTREGQGSEKATMANEPTRQPRRTFDEGFKRDAVALLLKGDEPVTQLGAGIGC
jgi:hypothetical protein